MTPDGSTITEIPVFLQEPAKEKTKLDAKKPAAQDAAKAIYDKMRHGKKK